MKKIVILALGDSLTEGYHSYGLRHSPYTKKLQELLGPDVVIENEGLDGDTTTNMLQRFKSLLKNRQNIKQLPPYTHLILLGGTNDISELTSDAILSNLNAIHSLAESNNIKSFAVTIPEHAEDNRWKWLPTERGLVNDGLRAKYTGRLIDLERELPRHTLTKEEVTLYWDDGLHYTAQGYQRMGEIIYNTIRDKL